ncbi:hypothetical protein BDN67DRAFT_983802 [Paxillus ammoniavirescens]|nr:hypothetical protein BDN67DRAFT_983802 [Paxillus ammoniavirescens]
MGRPTIYHTPENCAQAVRVSRQKYYERKMMAKYKSKCTSRRFSLQPSKEFLLAIESSSLKSPIEKLFSSPTYAEKLNHSVEDLILRAADIQKLSHSVEGNVLQQKGASVLFAAAQKVSVWISMVITALEDLLLSSMEESAGALFESNSLLFQKMDDICYGNCVLHR